MIITSILIGVGLGLLTAALVIAAYKLTTKIIKERTKSEIPKTSYVKIEKYLSQPHGKKVLPTYKAKAYDRYGNKLRDIEFKYEDSEYFYNGEKIYV